MSITYTQINKGSRVANGENVELISYAYGEVGGDAAFEGVAPARMLLLGFHNNILVATEFKSSYKSDSTYFNPEKAKSIKQGMTKAEVETLLGKPGGEHRYPVIQNQRWKALVYTYAQTKGVKSRHIMLIVQIDETGLVQKVDFSDVEA